MDVVQFQNKLNEICTLAEENQKTLTAEQIRTCFQDMDLEKDQLLKVLQYLKVKGITLEGMDHVISSAPGTEAEKAGQAEAEGIEYAVPLTAEEEAYLEAYQKDLEKGPDARTNQYLHMASELAAQMNCEDISLADLLQEANVVLFTILSESGKEIKDEQWMRGQLRKGIREIIEEQTQRKFEDDCLVAKVQNLENAVKELTEDEDDGEAKFSVDELAVILDMDVEEIRDVLRLTGDDK